MRIIITDLGRKIIDDKKNDIKRKEENLIDRPYIALTQFSPIKNPNSEKNKFRSHHKSQSLHIDKKQYLFTDNSYNLENQQKRVKFIDVNQKTFKISSVILQKYYKDKDYFGKQSEILPEIPKNLMHIKTNSINHSLTNSPNEIKSDFKNNILNTNNNENDLSFTLRDLVEPKVIEKIKQQKELKQKKLFFSSFRTNQKVNVNTEIEDKFNKEIKSENIHLIKYLNKKKDLSNIIIDKIADCNEFKLAQLNKHCILNEKKEEDGNFQDLAIKKKLNFKKNCQKIEFKRVVDVMKDSVDLSKEILDGYTERLKNYSKEKRDLRFREVFNHYKRNFWDSHNIDNLLRVKNKEIKYVKKNRFDEDKLDTTTWKSQILRFSD